MRRHPETSVGGQPEKYRPDLVDRVVARRSGSKGYYRIQVGLSCDGIRLAHLIGNIMVCVIMVVWMMHHLR